MTLNFSSLVGLSKLEKTMKRPMLPEFESNKKLRKESRG